jgi:SPP1 family predicted phage head-tail adaptor
MAVARGCFLMRIGPLRQRIVIQANTPTTVDHERVDSWAPLGTVSAEKRDPKGNEVVEQLGTEANLTLVFRIRYWALVSPAHRIVWDGRTFDIKAVTNPDQRKRWMMLFCKEHKTSGD